MPSEVSSMDEWTKERLHAHIHSQEYYSAVRKKKIPSSVTTWVDRREFVLSEVSQRKTNATSSHMWNLKNKTRADLQNQRITRQLPK